MRILHIAQAAGGVDRYLRMLLPRLHAYGFGQMLLCSTDYKEEDYQGSVDEFRAMEMPRSVSPMAIVRCSRMVRTIIKEYKPDVVYCHSSFAGGFGRLACIGLRVKVVYNSHGWAFDMRVSQPKKWIYLLMEKSLARLTDRFVLISNAEKISAITHHIAPMRKLQVIFNGIDFDSLKQSLQSGIVTRQQIGISDDAVVVGMVGRLTKQKAPDMFVRMAAEIVKTIKNAHFIIVGDGGERGEVEALAASLGIGDRLHITGWTETPMAYTALMDYAVLLSRWEGFGLVIAEYMYAKKPVVATAVDAIPDLITHGVNGMLVPVDDYQSAAKEVIHLYGNVELRESIINNAYNKTVACYDVNRVATEHIYLMRKLINIKSGG